MTARFRPLAIPLLLGAAALCLLSWGLEHSPVYLHHDEIFFGLQARSIAETGRDTNGRLFPLYFEISGGVWFQPMLVYVLAGVFRILPVSTFAVRFPTAVVGAIDVVLMYFVGRALFKSEAYAILAALLLLLTPAHFIHARLGMDYLYPVPFVLGWLLCVLKYLEQRQEGTLAVGSALLGVGFFSYLASVFMMPIYFAITCLALVASRASRRAYAVVAVAFAGPLLLLVLFVLRHPQIVTDFAHRYNVYDTARWNVLQGMHEFANYTSLTQRAYLYWMYFNPSYFFFSGGSNYVNATRHAGVFLFPFAILLPVGIYQAGVRPVLLPWIVVLLGFATGPLAAILVDEMGAIDRMLNILPFAILLAVGGARTLLGSRRVTLEVLGIALLLLLPLQFRSFVTDYFGDYRLRSATAFEENVRGAIEAVFARDRQQPAARVYLSEDIRYLGHQWQWYVLLYGRQPLLARTVEYRPPLLDLSTVPSGSLIVARNGSPVEERLLASGALNSVAEITEPTGVVSFRVLAR